MSDRNEEVCCPEFNPAPWNKTTHEWKEKPFLVKTVPQFMHMPLPGVYGKAVTALNALAEEEKILPDTKDFLMLAMDPSPWQSELYLAVTAEKPGLPVKKLSGTYASMVFDGSYSKVPDYITRMDKWLSEEGMIAKNYLFYYTTCPKCAKKYGHNYIVAFAEI